MHEFVIILALSILFTFITFIFSFILMKRFKITHPKNRYWIYAIVLMTAFSIFSLSFIAAGNSFTINGNEIDNFIRTDEEKI